MNEATPPLIEERHFTKAELKAFTAKYEAFQKAKAEADEFLSFLGEQYEIDPKEGWKVGEKGFYRQVVPAPPTPPAPPAPPDGYGV